MSMNYAAMATAKLAERSQLEAEGRSVQHDTRLTDAEKRQRIERINADMQHVTDEARSLVERAEREAEARSLGENAGKLVAPSSGGSNGAEVRMDQPLPPGKGFADLAGVRAKSAAEFGHMAQRLAYGESRAAFESSDSAGGFLVPTEYAVGVLDLARKQTQVVNAGAQVVPLSSDDQRIAKLTGDATPTWRNERAVIAESDLAFGEIRFTARSSAVLVKASRELIEDAANFGEVLQQSFAESFAGQLDAAALYGTGAAPQPLGLKNTSGVSITPLGANGATLLNWNPIIGAVS